jgi:HlyD family secretion protein
MGGTSSRRWLIAGIAAVAALLAAIVWLRRQKAELPPEFASGNGRIEATEYDIATKRAGRIDKVLAAEGDLVEAGQILAQMDIQDLQAELRQAEAGLKQAREDKKQALSIINQREADIMQASATIAQRESELALAQADFERAEALYKQELIAKQEFDQGRTRKLTAEAALAQERARKLLAEAALRTAQAQADQKQAAIEAADAGIQMIKTEINDSVLKSPIHGRVLYRLAEPGEMLAAGGKVLTVLELTDVYMTIFLPTAQAGRVTVGSEARIVLDAAPEYVIPATVSFVAPRSQFTPKEVETRTEREKLMFRIKVKIDPELLKKYLERVKTGLPGVAYVRLDSTVDWPDHLQVKLPQ